LHLGVEPILGSPAGSVAKGFVDSKGFSTTGNFSSNLEFADSEKNEGFVESIHER